MAGTFTNLLYHVVFSTKNRVPLISADWKEDLYSYIGGIIRNKKGVLLEINGIADHIHLLAKFKPYPSVSDMLKDIKASSSKWVNDGNRCGLRKFGWQDGYAAFTVSESQVEGVRSYIKAQEEHHRRIDFKTELRAMLDRHGIEYDERYLWT